MEETLIESIKNNTFIATDRDNLTEKVISALITSDNREYFDYLLDILPIERLIDNLNSVLDNAVSKYLWSDHGKKRDISDNLIMKIDYLIENYQLSGHSFAKTIIILLGFKNVDNLIKKIIDFQKFPTEYISSDNQCSIYHSNYSIIFVEKLCKAENNVFQYILGNTDVITRIKYGMIKYICRNTITDKLDFLWDNNMINPEEIDLAYLFDDRSYDAEKVTNIINFLEHLKSKGIMASTKIFYSENKLEYLFKLVDLIDQKVDE